MGIILWIIKFQWNQFVDRLTYDKSWSIERVSNLLLGAFSLAFASLSFLHHFYWIIPLGLINSIALVYLLNNQNIFQSILKNLGFEEKEKILLYNRKKMPTKVENKDIENNIYIFTSNPSNLFVFEILSSHEVDQNLNIAEFEQ